MGGGGLKNPTFLWTSYIEAPYSNEQQLNLPYIAYSQCNELMSKQHARSNYLPRSLPLSCLPPIFDSPWAHSINFRHLHISNANASARDILYRVVQLNFTPEIEAFYMLLDYRYLSIFSMTSLKQHMEYINLGV